MEDKNIEVNGNITGIGIVTGGAAVTQTIINEKDHQVPKQLTKTTGSIKNFIGREKELNAIERKLQNNNSLLLINGIGGIGKSSLAIQFLQNNKEAYHHYGFIVALTDLKSALFNHLHVNLRLRDYGKIDENFDEVLRGLRALEGDKLLLVDDMQDIENQTEAIEAVLELSRNGYKILFTSREEIEDVENYYLYVLSLEDAKALFRSIYPTDNESVLEEILGYLDNHALFIEMTAKTLKNKKKLTLEAIKEKFEKGAFAKISVKRKESFNNYLNQLFNFDRLDNVETLTLKQLSVLPSIEIEAEALEALLQKHDDEEFIEILDFLCEKGWLLCGNGSYKLHQIIKEYILGFYLPLFKDIEGVVDYFNHITQDVGDIQKAVEFRSSIIYFESLDRTLSLIEEKNEKVANFLNDFGLIHHYLGAYKKAEPLYLKSLNIRKEVLGESHSNTATSYNNLADLYSSMGAYKKAELLHLNALKINEEVLGHNHINTSAIYNNLAELYRLMGSYDKAKPLYLKALSIRKEVLGENHSGTAESYNNLALLYSSIGAYKKAKPLYLKALKIMKKVLGESHPNTAGSYSNLALLYQSMGIYKKAEALFLNALKIKEEVLGDNHPSTAVSYKNLAFFYYNTDELEKAYEFMKKAVDVWGRVLPENHPNLINSKESLGEIEQKLKQQSPIVSNKKTGRNAPCPCGSGQKYKKCCRK